MSEAIEAKLKDIRECIDDNWFVDNPNGSDVNEEIVALLDALEVAVGKLRKIRNDTVDEAAPYRSLGASGPVKDLADVALKQIEAKLGVRE